MALYTDELGRRQFNNELAFHIEIGNYDEVISLIENVDVKNLVDSSGMTLLHYAANTDNDAVAKYLIDGGCDVDALDSFGCTPLMYAVEKEHSQVVSTLLESDADVFLCDQNNLSPLLLVVDENCEFDENFIAAFFEALKRQSSADCRQIARMLLQAKCTLPRAMLLKNSVVTGYMLDGGCDVDDRCTGLRRTALHYALDYMDLDNVKVLLEHGADIYAEDGCGNIPLSCYKAGRENSYEMLMTLLNHDTSLSADNVKESVLVQEVLRRGQVNEVEALLLKFDFDFSIPNEEGDTLLHYISSNTNAGVMQLIEGRKFDVNARDKYGATALFEAAEYASLDGVKFLFEHGSDPNVVDEFGYTALFAAWEAWFEADHDIDLNKTMEKCLEIFVEFGSDFQYALNDVTIFDYYAQPRPGQFTIIRPAIAQVAMMEATGQNIEKKILENLDENRRYKKFFNFCRKKIEKLQKTMINKTVTLFQFLVDSEEKLVRCARNHESAAKLEKIIRRERRSKIFFMKRLRKRVEGIINMAKFREKAALNLSEISGCNNCDVIDIIISFLDKQSLQNLCEI